MISLAATAERNVFKNLALIRPDGNKTEIQNLADF